MEFQCKTCQKVLPGSEMMKHLSNTRHKTIVDNSTDEEVACEECQNDNIHQLIIVRFGGDDLNLFCLSCFNKVCQNESEKPNTQYTLQNGAILNYWDKYLVVRDCRCMHCGDNKRLNVKNLSKKKLVLCNKCLTKEPFKDGFVSEDSGKFIYALLDMPEPKKTTKRTLKKKRGRNVKRRGGRKGKDANSTKTAKPKKPLTALEKITRESFQYKKLNTVIESSSSVKLSSFKGFRASDSNGNLKSLQSTPSTTQIQNNKSPNKNEDKKAKKVDEFSKSKYDKKHSDTKKFNDSKSSKGNNKSTETKQNTRQLSWDDDQSWGNDSSWGGDSSWGPTDSNVSLSTHDTGLKDTDNNTSNKKKSKKSKKSKSKGVQEDTANNKKSVADTKGKPEFKQTLSSNSDSLWDDAGLSWGSDTWEPSTTDIDRKKATFSVGTSSRTSLSSLNEVESTSSTSKKKKKNKQNAKKETLEDLNIEDTDSGENKKKNRNRKRKSKAKKAVEEGTHVYEFSGDKKLLRFPNLTTYLESFSEALFREQRLENQFIEDFVITWPHKSKDKNFVISLKKNNPELQHILPLHLLEQGRIPFNENQPLMFCNYDETQVWYTFVKEVQKQRDRLVLLLELFPWNTKPLPINLPNDEFKMLPLSVQTNRIIFSMTRLTNPNFVELLLGNNKLKEIKFNNRLSFTKDTLNTSQKDAVEHVLNNSVTIIQGPPGTGKTSTIEEIILQLIGNFNSFPILCVAASNIAIDNIAEKLMQSKPDLKLLRILSDRKEKEYDEKHPLGKICLHNLINRELTPDEQDLLRRKRMGDPMSKNADMKLYKTITNLTTKYVSQAQILFTTNITAGGKQLKYVKTLPVVIMDESTQSSEVSTLVPLSLPGIKNFVFVGDDKQLSSFSNIPELEMSLFERILYNGSCATPKLLDTQYRMHPKISEFPIKYIYGSKLLNGVTAKDKYWPKLVNPLYFYNCDKGMETKTLNKANSENLSGYTYINTNECEYVVETIYKLMDEKNVQLKDIGVVTPYSAQRDYICEVLLQDKIINPDNMGILQQRDEDEFMNESYVGREVQSHVVNIINGLQVATIDSYQGHEKNFIIFSCVRSNQENNIGFLRDKRRLNVALTRSKYGLIVIGNKETLSKGDPLWKKYIEYCDSKKIIFNDLSQL